MKKWFKILFCLFLVSTIIGCSKKEKRDLKGDTGIGISSIEKTNTVGLVDTYTITFTDNETTTFTVTNGSVGLQGTAGIQGIQGVPGEDGHTPVITIGNNGNWFIDGVDTNKLAEGLQGDTGNGISSIEKTNTEGLTDTYTITFTNGTTTNFTITNGADGAQGPQGVAGPMGNIPSITIGYNGNWFIDGMDTLKTAQGLNGNDASHYNETHIVTYHLEGGTLPEGCQDTTTVGWGDTLNLPIPTKYGYEFIGWYTGNTVFDRQFYSFDAIFTDLNLYAKYEEGTYTLTLDINGGTYSGDTEVTYKFGDPYVLPSKDSISIQGGYSLKNWTYNGGVIEGNGAYNYEDITVVAEYEKSPTHVITLRLSGGEYNGQTEITVHEGGEYILPKVGVTHSGAVFLAGWKENNYYSNIWEYTGTFDRKTDVFLYAQWQDILTFDTLVLDYNGGVSSFGTEITGITNKQLYEGYTFPVPTKEDYVFLGYYYGNLKITDDSGRVIDFINFSDDITLVARYMYIGSDKNIFGDYAYIGEYPQTEVKDLALIARLSTIEETNDKGYLEYNGKEYARVNAEFTTKSYYSGSTYYFEVEPILWRVNSDKVIVSEYILDNKIFYNSLLDRPFNSYGTPYANNYAMSEIRAYLDGNDGRRYGATNYVYKGFFDIAFDESEKNYFYYTEIDNSAETTEDPTNPNACSEVYDRAWLLSYQDVNNSNYGFFNEWSMRKKPTDFAICMGSFPDSYSGYSSWWLRSPSKSSTYEMCYVDDYGTINYSNVIDEHGIVPVLKIVD